MSRNFELSSGQFSVYFRFLGYSVVLIINGFSSKDICQLSKRNEGSDMMCTRRPVCLNKLQWSRRHFNSTTTVSKQELMDCLLVSSVSLGK